MSEWLRNQNRCGIWCRRLSIDLQRRWVREHLTVGATLKAKSSKLDLTSTGKPVSGDSNENAASSSQVRQSGANSSPSAGTPVAETTKKPMATKLSHHNMTISRNYVDHLERVYSNVRQKLGRQPGEDTFEIHVNVMIW